MSYGISGLSDGSIGMTTTWNEVAMPSPRASAYNHLRLTKSRRPGGQTGIGEVGQAGRQLRTGSWKWVSMSSPVDSHPVSFSTSDGGSKLTANQSGKLRRKRCRISTLNPDCDGDDEEEGQDGEEDMEDEDSEATSLEYRTANARAGGRPGPSVTCNKPAIRS